MTCNEQRKMQLDQLKDGIFPGDYIVERLGRGTFNVIESFTFDSREKAIDKYNELASYIPSGYLRKYVKFTF